MGCPWSGDGKKDAKLDWSVMLRVPCAIHQEEDRKSRSDDR
jgi:hypothetical protein